MSSQQLNYPRRRMPRFASILPLILLVLLSCKLFDRSEDLQATITAIQAVQTGLAGTSAALAPLAPTLTAVHPLPATPTQAPGLSETILPQDTATPTAGTPLPPDEHADERLMKSARILLFEDMSASRYIRLVKEALDRDDYFYVDVGSAKGWFKTQLLSGQSWDLVIAAAEAQRDFGGEFFEYLDNHLAKGEALIVENWDLDLSPQGYARPLFDRCGVAFQSDWFEPTLQVFYWTDLSHPIFNRPNLLQTGLRNVPGPWSGDMGDLMALKPGGGQDGESAQILASTNRDWNTDHGLIVSCVGGRMILQTFRSHEYHHDDMVALWQNYIDYTLRSHFAYTKQQAPPVAPTAAAPVSTTPEITRGATPGPDYSFPHPCSPWLNVRLLRSPIFQTDLFEHHAVGTFMTLQIEAVNISQTPIQVWDGDYSLEANLYEKPVTYTPQRAATGYLYIEQGGNMYQDLIEPGETWHTGIVFDVAPDATDWVFVLRPGFKFNETACEVRIPLTK